LTISLKKDQAAFFKSVNQRLNVIEEQQQRDIELKR